MRSFIGTWHAAASLKSRKTGKNRLLFYGRKAQQIG